jgi:predicted DCC family thiol-disulfide oxidoreductase YuxK
MAESKISKTSRRVLPPGDRAIVLYDGTCNLCKTISTTLLDWDKRRGTLLVTPIQTPAGDRLLGDLDDETRLSSFHFVDTDGTRYSGGIALAPMFARLPGGLPIAKLLRSMPGPVDVGYEFIATNRQKISKFVPGRLKARSRKRLDEVLADKADELDTLTAKAEQAEAEVPGGSTGRSERGEPAAAAH